MNMTSDESFQIDPALRGSLIAPPSILIPKIIDRGTRDRIGSQFGASPLQRATKPGRSGRFALY
jgi:hypothetical protein